MMRRFTQILVAGALAVGASSARAQQQQPPRPPQQPARRQETIEMRGQVPTPQVVTVRPRETPADSRRVLVPAFFDHDFWPSILPPLQLVPAPTRVRADSLAGRTADSASNRQRATPRAPSGTPPAPLRR